MKCCEKCALLLSLCAPLIGSGTALAEDPQSSLGFHGDLMVGGMWNSTDNRLVPGDDNKQVDSLAGDGETESDWSFMAMGNLSYTTSTGTRIFFSADGSFSAGIGQEIAGIADVSLAGVYLQGEVWKDPYLTGTNRDDTDEARLGGRLNIDGILGTGLNFGYSSMGVEVDEDLIGKKEALLQREGVIHSFTTGYAIPLDDNNSLVPQLQYESGDLDGASNRYDRWGGGLTHTFTNKYLLIATTFSANKAEYDHRHPIFEKTRDEEIYAVSSTVSWLNPLGFENYVVSATASYARTNANINFFDSADTMVGMGIGYRF